MKRMINITVDAKVGSEEMTDYLTRQDKLDLERMGYTPYNGEYGYVAVWNKIPRKIVGRYNNYGDDKNIDNWLIISELGLESMCLKGLSPILKTLAPEIKEMVLMPEDWDVSNSIRGGELRMLFDNIHPDQVERFMRENHENFYIKIIKGKG
jgi:hypothetical protein